MNGAGPRWILHPVFIAAAFVLDVALANEVEPAGFARPVAMAMLGAGALTLAGWAGFRDRWSGGLAATLVIVLVLSLHPITAGWEALDAGLGPNGAAIGFGVLLFLILAAPGVLILRARRSHRSLRRPATDVLNRLSAVMVVVVVAVHAGPDVPSILGRLAHQNPAVAVAATDDPPDMFILLLDGYPRADVLSRRFGIDNAPFLEDLRRAGFDVAEDSRSNYIFTQLTLASMFQMRHIQDIPALQPLIGTDGAHHGALRDALRDGQAFAALRAGGYEIVTVSPGYEHTTLRGVADRVLDHGEYTDLETNLVQRTWLFDLLLPFFPAIYSGPLGDRVVHAFDDLETLAVEPRDRPVFAFIHVPAPHLPLLVDADGDALLLSPRTYGSQFAHEFGMTDAEFAAAYAEQLAYLNRRTLAAIEALQSTDRDADPVIVVMSDHGYTHDVDRIDIEARFGTLLAAHTPGADGLFADPPTLVNLISRLLNQYLATEFAPAPDRHFISAGPEDLLQLTEVAGS